MKKLLVTGHLGLVGRFLTPKLKALGFQVVGFDLADRSGDITCAHKIQQALADCHGVVHLAAVSRVVFGERDPEKCWQTNALASEVLLRSAVRNPTKPWVLVTSSREVYGESAVLPVHENMPLQPVNVYGRAKLYMEQATLRARETGLNTSIVRLANVYGCVDDHSDRVLPAFCSNAVMGKPLRVDGFNHLFDFTHVSDAVTGISRLVQMLDMGERNIPPVHLVPGLGTTLKQAAELAVNSAASPSRIFEAASRQYDVCRFVGNPDRAKNLLGWQAKVFPKEGIALLVEAFKARWELRTCV